MAEDQSSSPQPRLSDKGKSEAQARQERLAAQLRANLRRRKEQSRGRDAEDGDGGPASE